MRIPTKRSLVALAVLGAFFALSVPRAGAITGGKALRLHREFAQDVCDAAGCLDAKLVKPKCNGPWGGDTQYHCDSWVATYAGGACHVVSGWGVYGNQTGGRTVCYAIPWSLDLRRAA